jgi:hypothetical protein
MTYGEPWKGMEEVDLHKHYRQRVVARRRSEALNALLAIQPKCSTARRLIGILTSLVARAFKTKTPDLSPQPPASPAIDAAPRELYGVFHKGVECKRFFDRDRAAIACARVNANARKRGSNAMCHVARIPPSAGVSK